METLETISKVAKILHVSTSKLRYWDDEGLIRFSRNPQNNYRNFSFQTMMDICDIILYRSLSMPIKTIKDLPSADIDDLYTIFNKSKDTLIKQIENMKKTIEKIEAKTSMIDKFINLNNSTYTIEKHRFNTINTFQFDNERNVQDYLDDPYKTLIIIDMANKGTIEYGILTETIVKENVLREKDKEEKLYLKGILAIEAKNTSNHNGHKLINEAIRLGYKPGNILGLYVISANDGENYDYYEAWLELTN